VNNLIYFFNQSWIYGYSMKPLYEKLKAEGYDVSWNSGFRPLGLGDSQVVCHLPSLTNEAYWKNCIYVPHSVSEYFPYGYDEKRWIYKFKGILSVGLMSATRDREHPICDAENIKLVGWPRGDILFGSKKAKIEEKLREDLKLPHEKTVLFVSATSGYLYRETPMLNEIISLSKGKFNLLIKDRETKYSNMFSGVKNIRYLTHLEDITPYYLITDVLVSAHPASSSLVEISQVNKPSITVNFGDENWINRWRYHFLGEADVFCKLGELVSNVTALLESSDEYSPKIKEKLERFIYKPDGRATDRGIEVLKELIK